MSIYLYRCDRDGEIEVTRPIGQAPASITCEVCGASAPRVFSSPQLSFSSRRSRAIATAIEHADGTADRPDVVTSLPPATGRRRPATVPLTPTLRRLPRP